MSLWNSPFLLHRWATEAHRWGMTFLRPQSEGGAKLKWSVLAARGAPVLCIPLSDWASLCLEQNPNLLPWPTKPSCDQNLAALSGLTRSSSFSLASDSSPPGGVHLLLSWPGMPLQLTFLGLDSVSVHWGCHNKISWIEWPENNRNLLGAWEVQGQGNERSRCPQIWDPTSCVIDDYLLAMSSFGWGGQRCLWSLFPKGTNFMYILADSQRHHFQIPSYWRLGFNVILGRYIQSTGVSFLAIQWNVTSSERPSLITSLKLPHITLTSSYFIFSIEVMMIWNYDHFFFVSVFLVLGLSLSLN